MTLPQGLVYVPGFLTEAEERDVLAVLATVELHPYVLHDTPSQRLVLSFGLALVTGAYDAGPAAPIPAELPWLRERCAGLMGRESEELVDLLVARYPLGARDRLAPRCAAVRRGQRHLVADRVPDAVPPRPTPRLADGRTYPRARSAYVLSGPARTQWQHHIPPVTQERWSMTFRTLRHAAADAR
jgi:DNA oxidative demethylase